MPDDQFYELLGDDGEFKEPVDSDFGVYSLHRRGYWWRISAATVGMFVFALIAVSIWYF